MDLTIFVEHPRAVYFLQRIVKQCDYESIKSYNLNSCTHDCRKLVTLC